MAESERLEFRVSRDLLDRIDEARGPVPRGTWIKAVLAREVGCATPEVEGKALVVANRARAAARLEQLRAAAGQKWE